MSTTQSLFELSVNPGLYSSRSSSVISPRTSQDYPKYAPLAINTLSPTNETARAHSPGYRGGTPPKELKIPARIEFSSTYADTHAIRVMARANCAINSLSPKVEDVDPNWDELEENGGLDTLEEEEPVEKTDVVEHILYNRRTLTELNDAFDRAVSGTDATVKSTEYKPRNPSYYDWRTTASQIWTDEELHARIKAREQQTMWRDEQDPQPFTPVDGRKRHRRSRFLGKSRSQTTPIIPHTKYFTTVEETRVINLGDIPDQPSYVSRSSRRSGRYTADDEDVFESNLPWRRSQNAGAHLTNGYEPSNDRAMSRSAYAGSGQAETAGAHRVPASSRSSDEGMPPSKVPRSFTEMTSRPSDTRHSQDSYQSRGAASTPSANATTQASKQYGHAPSATADAPSSYAAGSTPQPHNSYSENKPSSQSASSAYKPSVDQATTPTNNATASQRPISASAPAASASASQGATTTAEDAAKSADSPANYAAPTANNMGAPSADDTYRAPSDRTSATSGASAPSKTETASATSEASAPTKPETTSARMQESKSAAIDATSEQPQNATSQPGGPQSTASAARAPDAKSSSEPKMADGKSSETAKTAIAAKTPEPKTADKKTVEDSKPADKKPSAAEAKKTETQKKAAEQKTVEKKPADDKKAVEENKAADKKAVDDKKPAETKAAGEKKADKPAEKTADKKPAETKAAEEKKAATEKKKVEEDKKATDQKKEAEKKPSEEKKSADKKVVEDKKAEEKKAEVKKVEEKKAEPKKAEEKKPDNKKVEPKKAEEKKAEEKKAEEKKAEVKKAEEKKADAKKPEEKKQEEKQADAKKAEEKKAEAKKAEEKKAEEKKVEAKKGEEKKAEAKKVEEKKAEEKKAETKKAEEKKPEAKKAEEKKPEAKKADDKKPEAKKAEEKKPEAKKSDSKPAEAVKATKEVNALVEKAKSIKGGCDAQAGQMLDMMAQLLQSNNDPALVNKLCGFIDSYADKLAEIENNQKTILAKLGDIDAKYGGQ